MPRAIEKLKRANSYYEFGIIYLREKKYGKAIKAFEEAIAIYPNYAKALTGLKKAEHKQKEHRNNVIQLVLVFCAVAGFIVTVATLIIAVLSWQFPKSSREEEQQVLVNKVPNASSYSNLGVVDDENYDKDIEIDTKLAQAHYNLGLAYADKGEYDKAIVSYKKAIELKPDYADAHIRLGLVYYEEAIASLSKAIEIDSNNIATKIILEVIKQLKPQQMKAQQ